MENEKFDQLFQMVKDLSEGQKELSDDVKGLKEEQKNIRQDVQRLDGGRQ